MMKEHKENDKERTLAAICDCSCVEGGGGESDTAPAKVAKRGKLVKEYMPVAVLEE